MTGLVEAIGFLTRVPARRRTSAPPALAGAVPWFPVVGALVGLAQAGVYLAAREVLPPYLSAALAVTAQIVLTGAFHEDGLADTADAVGGWTREDRLRIMTDSLHGTYGVAALVASFALRSAALAALDGWVAVGALVAAHALGRATPALLMLRLPPAAAGLGAAYGADLTRAQGAQALAAAVVITVIGLRGWAVLAVATAVALVVVLGRWARGALGGVTGDVLGAGEQLTEISVVLLAAAIA